MILTSSMDLKVEPRYTLMIWHGSKPKHDACKYLKVLIGLMAKNEFCKPKGMGVSLDSNTNWNASRFDFKSILSFFNIDPEFDWDINL